MPTFCDPWPGKQEHELGHFDLPSDSAQRFVLEEYFKRGSVARTRLSPPTPP